MTNGEKYKTEQERADAFGKWCRVHNHNGVKKCGSIPCMTYGFKWLDLEAEEEKLLPCPFCGNTVMHKHEEFADLKVFVVCPTCGYRSSWEFNLGVAIAAHNRVAKKCMEEKE